MKYSLTMPQKVVFGCGEAANIPKLAAALGTRFLIAANPPLVASGAVQRLADGLAAEGLCAEVYGGVTGEPTPQMVEAAAELAVRAGCDALIGIGGGSAMDVAKAAAGIATNGAPVKDYLEGVGTLRRMTKPPLPFIAVPTTSGTGAEATKNAVISDAAAGYKASFRSDSLMARLAVVDPELTVSSPPNVTAWSGMDALTQLMEAYISRKSQPFTDALALSGIEAASGALKRAFEDGGDIGARERMAYGSHLSGICLANAGLGAAHGLAAAFGAVEGTPHGLICAVLLPHVMELNMPHTGGKAKALSRALTGKEWPDAGDNGKAVTGFIRELASSLGIPDRLGLQGMDAAREERLLAAVSRSSMSGNPVELGREDVLALIRQVC